jgi:hypothetical protein
MPLHHAGGLDMLNHWQEMFAVLALFRQDGPNLVDSLGRDQRPMRSTMAGLATRIPPALLAPIPWTRLARQSIGRSWLGRIRGVLLVGAPNPLSASRRLRFAFQRLRFAFRARQSAVLVCYLAPEFFILSQQPIILPAQLSTAGLVRVPIALPICPFSFCAARLSRIHPG